MAAIFGEFGVDTIQSPIFLKPNMQFLKFVGKALNGPM
jgi:hypothetical protein